jgi:type III restriction enzyme
VRGTLFETEELIGYLKNMVDVKRGVHEQVIYQSQTEANFAKELDSNESVKVFAKLPGWFKIPTPLGPYNPDWAVLADRDGTERLYFVVETKYSLYDADLRDKEGAKIDCGEAHFEALAVGKTDAAKFKKAVKVSDLF